MTQPTFASVTGELGEDIAAVRADLAKLSGLVVDLARSQAETVRAQVQQSWGDRKPHGIAGPGDAPGPHRTGLTATIVRDPLPSLLLALAGGFALGMLSRRR